MFDWLRKKDSRRDIERHGVDPAKKAAPRPKRATAKAGDFRQTERDRAHARHVRKVIHRRQVDAHIYSPWVKRMFAQRQIRKVMKGEVENV